MEAREFRNSLCLISVNALDLGVFAPSAAFGDDTKRIQGLFQYNGVYYSLRVTDHDYEYTYLQRPEGNYRIGPCFLTVSLGEPYKGYAYKLIAAIIKF